MYFVQLWNGGSFYCTEEDVIYLTQSPDVISVTPILPYVALDDDDERVLN